MGLFEQKFGKGFLSSIPTCPGVYLIYAENETLIYVGKARSLRRRLRQYEKLKRSKRDSKKKKILTEAVSLTWKECPSELDALLLENHLIQKHRPKFNVSAAFSFLYPYVGIRIDERGLALCYTTKPAAFSEFTLFGAFRSRLLTRSAFFALTRLFSIWGHLDKRKTENDIPRYSYVRWFRKLPDTALEQWSAFLRGDNRTALEELVAGLLTRQAARKNPARTQEDIDALKRFFRKEAKVLQKALKVTGYPTYPVPQNERDPLFLSYRFSPT